ncbi:MAG: hypothetical protein JO111_12975 [Caulobacteraceae bacterium]|nr:hypothetical protein [Caulobacteraceae bacterium]
MTGAVLALTGGVAGTTGGYSGSPGAVSWGNINAFDGGTNNNQTLTGVTGSMLVSASITGAGGLFYVLNGGAGQFYTGPFLWPEGQTLCWGVNTSGGNVAGTVTVENDTAGTTLASFTYSVKVSRTGGL